MKNLSADTLKQEFQQHFPDINPNQIQVIKAPGRVNLIGEHTDYNDGFVLPVAINYYTYIAFSPYPARELHIIASDFGNELIIIDLDKPLQKQAAGNWKNYVLGVVQEMLNKNLALTGGKLLISGNVPVGAGLSSSASLEIALIRALTILSENIIDPTLAAIIGQAAENNFVGCSCGIMDQLISARGEESSALLIDCENLSTKSVSIPNDWALLIVHSGVKRGLVDSEYNLRRQQCETVAKYFGQSSLRKVTLEQLFAAENKLDTPNNLDTLSFRRARHVLTENKRTLLAADALAAGNMPALVTLMAESHQSMRDDFNITTASIDKLVEIMTAAGNGNAGVRMTGGGFGGCVISIAPADIIPQLIAAVERNYKLATGCTPTLIPAKAVAGAFAAQ